MTDKTNSKLMVVAVEAYDEENMRASHCSTIVFNIDETMQFI